MCRLGGARYVGLAGSCLLAGSGWIGGALPAAAETSGIAHGRLWGVVLAFWLVGTVAQGWAWWSVRDHAFTPRWAMNTIALWTAPFLFVPPMGSRDVYSYACQGQLFAQGINPYHYGADRLPCSWLDAVSPIWRETTAPYGPLFVLVAAAIVMLGSSLISVVVLFRLLALAGLIAVAACLPLLARRCAVPVERALWVGLAGPLVGVHLIAGAHNEGLMLGLVVAGLALAVRGSERPVVSAVAGAVLGLAAAVKVTAIVAVPFAVLIAAGAAPGRRRIPAAARFLAGGAAASMATATAATGLGLGWATGLRQTDDLIQFTSPPTAVGMTLTYIGKPFVDGFDAVPAVRLVALVVLAAALVYLWLRAYRADEPVSSALRGAATAFAVMAILSPVFQPWYALWPLTLLAATTVRTNSVMLVAVLSALSVLPDGGGLARFVKFPGAPLMTIAILVATWIFLRRRRLSAANHRQPSEVTLDADVEERSLAA